MARSGNVQAHHYDSHRLQARLENAHFLMDECYLSLVDTAHRLGVGVACLEKELEREKAKA